MLASLGFLPVAQVIAHGNRVGFFLHIQVNCPALAGFLGVGRIGRTEDARIQHIALGVGHVVWQVGTYVLVQEDHCMGHKETREITVADYRKEQGIEEYDELNREYYRLILKKKSAGPAVGKPSPTCFQFFFLACYDIDRFKEFINSANFRNVYNVPEEEFERINNDDVERLKFGYRLLKQVLFEEESIALHEGAFDKRMEERKEILETRRQAEIAVQQDKEAFEKYIDD